jgi:hypothetical protein
MGTTVSHGRETWRRTRSQLQHVGQPGFGLPWQMAQTPGPVTGTDTQIAARGSATLRTVATCASEERELIGGVRRLALDQVDDVIYRVDDDRSRPLGIALRPFLVQYQ